MRILKKILFQHVLFARVKNKSASCAKSTNDKDEIASLSSVNSHSISPSINMESTSDTFSIKKSYRVGILSFLK